MKKLILSGLLLAVFAITCFSQVPSAISYQAVVRNSTGEIIANQNVSFRISILQNSETGSPVYVETHFVTTNGFGLANLKIGMGSVENGIFAPGGWGVASHFIKTEFDAEGGNAYIHMGTTQLLAVPYAFHANTVENDNVDDADNDPENELQSISLDGNELTLSDGGTVSLPSSEGADDWGTQVVESDATITGDGTIANPLSSIGDNWGEESVTSDLTLSGKGTEVSPLSVDGDLTDDQELSIVGSDLTISGGNTIALPQSSNYWSKNYADELYSELHVGIGTDNPQFELDIYDDENAAFGRIYSNANNAGLMIDRKDVNDMAYTRYSTSNDVGFYTGMIGNSNYRISSDVSTLKGLEVFANGDVNLSDNLLIENGKYIGIGAENPIYPIDIQGGSPGIRLKATSSSFFYGNTNLVLDKASELKYADIIFRNNGTSKFYTGLLGNDNYRISTTSSTLNGIEVESDGDVVLSDELHTTSTGTANMLPYAYGYITGGVVLARGTSNVTSVEYDTNHFVVTINGLDDYIVLVTPSSDAVNERVVYDTNTFYVYFRDEVTYAYVHANFSFVVFKL